MNDPNRWQPLSLAKQHVPERRPDPGNVQTFIGSHWGAVTAVRAAAPSDDGTPIDPGPPPRLGDPATDAAFKRQAVEVIRYSSQLDPADGVTIDICPGAAGDDSLGTNDGNGHETEPGHRPAIRPRMSCSEATSPASSRSSGRTGRTRRRRRATGT